VSELATGGENREIVAGAAEVRADDLQVMDQSFEGV
jgi:hypothetical protein